MWFGRQLMSNSCDPKDYSLKGWNVQKLTRWHESGPLAPCPVNNDFARCITAELAYGIAHAHHEVLARPQASVCSAPV